MILIYTMLYMMLRWDLRTRILIHCDELLYIVKGSGHRVRPVCSYWPSDNTVDRQVEDCDGHAHFFTSVPVGSSGEDLENIK